MKTLTVEQSRRAFLAHVAEGSLQKQLIDELTLTGHLVVHFRPARTKTGWRTPLSGHPGFPDVVALSPPDASGRCLLKVAEIKTLTGRYRSGQEAWLARFRASGALVITLRPGMDDEFAEFVQARPT
ncbi:MAG TPA: VRR-NUC domain-containing protein [Actinomycetota bacterium]|nr:VRR-NUC domain-containing protein [Actinomycetota bacterium]